VSNILIKGIDIKGNLLYPINVAQNKGYTIKESARLIAKAIGYEGELVFNTNYQDGTPHKILTDTRFRATFPDYEFYNHEDGIKETVEYYKAIL
jgi:GDP-L-fucose synthase